jgi:drug/metabolite transporter (DMT)-like permease
MIFLPLTTAVSSTTKFIYKDLMKTVPWYNAAIYKGIFRGVVSIISLLILVLVLSRSSGASASIDAKASMTLFVTQILYVSISFYHMYLLATTASPTVLGATISCLLLIFSLIIGRAFYGELLNLRQICGVCLAIVAIALMKV